MEEKTVISASRTRDLVRCAPGLLARMLSGAAPVRFARTPALRRLDPGETGALVLWTKDAGNIVDHAPLGDALSRFIEGGRRIVVLNLTITGLGGSILEPGIPDAAAVVRTAARVLASGLVRPEAVIMRYDPLISVAARRAAVTNMDPALFGRIAGRCADLGVRRIKVSSVDYGYAHVPKRLSFHGIEPVRVKDESVLALIDDMMRISEKLGMRLDVCCNPERRVDEETDGCVDGRMINRLLERNGSPCRVTERLHNDVGRQRKTCRCTYSADIGYSPDVPGCFGGDGACLYCYSQRTLRGPGALRTGASPLTAEQR
jgi:hypothetical protein